MEPTDLGCMLSVMIGDILADTAASGSKCGVVYAGSSEGRKGESWRSLSR
jgi:hypothetical protein